MFKRTLAGNSFMEKYSEHRDSPWSCRSVLEMARNSQLWRVPPSVSCSKPTRSRTTHGPSSISIRTLRISLPIQSRLSCDCHDRLLDLFRRVSIAICLSDLTLISWEALEVTFRAAYTLPWAGRTVERTRSLPRLFSQGMYPSGSFWFASQLFLRWIDSFFPLCSY